LRRTAALAGLVRETRLSVSQLIAPLFVVPGKGLRREIGSMPGQFHYSVDQLVREAGELAGFGIPAVLLFGIPEHKDGQGSEAWKKDGAVQRGIRALKKEFPDLLVMTDVCLCEYASHGHCGVVASGRDGKGNPVFEVANDPSLKLLARAALSHAEAGADLVAPSDMMDGRVGAIRHELDQHGHSQVGILSYAAKYASAFYGPFRDAADSAPAFGDRSGYQMDPANAREALREIELDLEEGADMIMVKPALSYLDIIREARDRFDAPLAAYQVSGEYSMVKAAEARGWVDGKRLRDEILLSIRRAGADCIITYFAKEYARDAEAR
jgi:porphobilinogen synthase